MSDFSLSLHALRARLLGSFLAVLLTAFGVMTALVVLQFSASAAARIARDGAGIDIVIGAKGSPLQLVLSALYHADVPTGNMPYAEAEKWMRHPQVRAAYPLALGDNWRGFRIVGTVPEYPAHYGATLAAGRMWEKPFEAVAGAATGLSPGAAFAGAHGLDPGGHRHDDHLYRVVGVLKPTGSVIDRLILTPVDSVLRLHGQALPAAAHDHDHDHDHEHHHHHDDDHDHDHAAPAGDAEITALLVRAAGPLAHIHLPRAVNQNSQLIAANPALEMARLGAVFGIGTRTLGILSACLIGLAALGIFAGVASSLEARGGDLAVLRALGYTPLRLFLVVFYEGMMLSAAGLALGLALGRAGYLWLSQHLPALVQGQAAPPDAQWLLLSLCVLAAGFCASLPPALRAARTDPAALLSMRAA